MDLHIDIVSDVVCPWCYIGTKRLDRARDLAGDVEVTVNWRPYQLDPSVPPGGVDRVRYMTDKFGSEERYRQLSAGVAQAGQAAGIAFDFDAMATMPNTLDAHRLIRWAAAEGGASMQDRVVRALFAANFEEGRDIGDHAVLADIAATAGMDRAVVETLLASNADADAVRDEIAAASRMGVTGVPCFLLEGRYALVGAQEPETLADAIRQVASAKARGELPAGA